MEPEYVVLSSMEKDGLFYELVIVKATAEVVESGSTDVFWVYNPAVRVSRVES